MFLKVLLCILALLPQALMAFDEHQHFVIPNSKDFAASFKFHPEILLKISNPYGDIRVIFSPTTGSQIQISGAYESTSSLPGEIHFFKDRQGSYHVQIDGPALFKSHDHTKSNDKPLDRKFFEDNVGRLPFVEAGQEPGSINVGNGALILRADGTYIVQRSSIFGRSTLGRNLLLYPGASIGLLNAKLDITVTIPQHGIRSITLSAKAGDGIAVIQPNEYRPLDGVIKEPSPEVLMWERTGPSACGPVWGPHSSSN